MGEFGLSQTAVCQRDISVNNYCSDIIGNFQYKSVDNVLAMLQVLGGLYGSSGPQLPKGCGCIGFLSPMHKKDPRFLFEKRRG